MLPCLIGYITFASIPDIRINNQSGNFHLSFRYFFHMQPLIIKMNCLRHFSKPMKISRPTTYSAFVEWEPVNV